MNGNGWITVSEAAEALEITPRAVRQRIAEDKLKAKKKGRSWYIKPSDDLASVVAEDDTEVKGKLISQLQSENQHLREELKEKNRQLEQQNMIIMKMTQQMESQTLMLEDLRNRSLWTRVKTALGFAPS